MSKDEIKRLAAHMQSPYADSSEALILMGLKNVRDLKYLDDEKFLFRHKRKGNQYVYLKTECLACAEKISKGEIVLPNKPNLK